MKAQKRMEKWDPNLVLEKAEKYEKWREWQTVTSTKNIFFIKLQNEAVVFAKQFLESKLFQNLGSRVSFT